MISAGGVAGVAYYTGGGGSGHERPEGTRNYYTGASEKGEPPGQWSGRLAEELGLTGEVRGEDMETVFTKFEAPDGTKLGRAPGVYGSIEDRVESILAQEPNALPERIEQIKAEVARSSRSANLGIDLTFSPPKSVTVAHTAAWRAELDSTRSGDEDRAARFRSIREGIEGAVLDANAAAMGYVSTVATSRAGKHGGGQGTWVAAPDLVHASFLQHTSRANDPQIHVHNATLNRARNVDGQIRALDTVDLVKQRHAYSAVADRVLAERLGDMGIVMATRPDGLAREVMGVDQSTMDLFSQRRQQITKAMEPAVASWEEKLGRELNALERGQLAQTINLATRQKKTADEVDWEALLDSWQGRTTDELGRGLTPLAERLADAVEAGPTVRGSAFSPSSIGAEAVQAVSEKHAAWTKADLMLEVELRLPLMGLSNEETVALINSVTDRAITEHGVQQVAGGVGIEPPLGLVNGSYVRPSAVRYAAPVTLEAERLIRQAAIERGRESLNAVNVNAWLDQHYPRIGADQRAAVVGIASSDAALAQIVGPAGTGKSYAAGALTGSWQELKGGTVHGLAVSQNAAEVLREDGVVNSANMAAWIAAQERLEAGNPLPSDLAHAVGPYDIVLVDEASMVGTAELDRVRDVVDSIKARMVLMGDPAQLSSVGAGGAMNLVADRAETYTLSDVRRFSEEWEGKASLRLRDGDREALAEYDKRGRLVDSASMEEAIAAAARAAAADRIAGLSVCVSADTNEDAARVASAVRDHLVAAGLVEESGVALPRTGGVAGIGDQIMTRQNDYGLEVINRERFEVIGTGEDGSLSVRAADGAVRELPAGYVQEHVQLAYGSTVHASQGGTFDKGYVITDGRSDSAAIYVGLTRGRDRNTAFVALQPTGQEKAPHVEEGAPRPTARTVLEDCLERESEARSATIEAERDEARLHSMDTISDRIEHATQLVCRTRMDNDLDRLVEDGVLSEDHRARLASDQASEHLSRVLRAAEQAGLSPEQVLREAIAQRPLEGAQSVAQVLSSRITQVHDVVASTPGRTAPERLSEAHSEYLAAWQERAAERGRELGSQAAQEQPAWATKALGAVPDDAMARLEWEVRAGAVASYREAAGFDDAERAIGSAPGVSATEKRAEWWQAWEALGKPEETRAEAALTDGQLQARVSAWKREQEWAPPFADESLRQSSLDAERARQEAVLAQAAGEAERAAELEAEAERRAAVARGMDTVADARGEWAANTAVTRDLAERAEKELAERGVQPGAEEDRVTAEEWLEEDRRVKEAEDEIRPVTEADVPVSEPESPSADGPTTQAPEPEVDDRPAQAYEYAPLEPDDLELEALVGTATEAQNTIADRESEEAVHDDMEAELSAAPEADLDGPDMDVAEVMEFTPGPFKPWNDDE